MIAGEQDLRHRPPVPYRRTAVLGVFQQAVEVALVLKALRVGKHPRNHAAHRIRHRHGGNLPAGEDEVTQRNFLVHALVNKPLVNALVMAADQNQIVQLAQANGVRLTEGMPAGGQIDGMHLSPGLVAHRLPAAV